MEHLFLRWQQLLGRLKIQGYARETFREITCLYSLPPRFYHTYDGHINHCLVELDSIRQYVSDAEYDLLEYSLNLHDIIMVFGAPDNEKKSAEYAVELAERLGCARSFQSAAYGLIMATAQHLFVSGTESRLEQLMRDIDTSILGCQKAVYVTISRKIRREFNFVSEDQFKKRRLMFLQALSSREHIYLSDIFRQRYEKQARQNINQEIGELRKAEVLI